MTTPKLVADLEGGNGSVSFPPAWNELSALMRADLLKDWLFDLQAAYSAAVDQIVPSSKELCGND